MICIFRVLSSFLSCFLSSRRKGLIYIESRKIEGYIPLNHSTASAAFFFLLSTAKEQT